MDINQVKIALGMDRLSCLECEHIEHMTEGEQGQYDYGYLCWKEGRGHVANLKTFPFKTDQECCQPAFWHTRFAELYSADDIKDLRVRNQFFIVLEELGLR